MNELIVAYCSKISATASIAIILFVTRSGNHIEIIAHNNFFTIKESLIFIVSKVVGSFLRLYAKQNPLIVMTFNPELNFAINRNLQTISWSINRISIIHAHFYIQRWLLVINIREYNRYNSSRVIPERNLYVLYKHVIWQNFRILAILQLSTILVAHPSSVNTLDFSQDFVLQVFLYRISRLQLLTVIARLRSIFYKPNITLSSILRFRPAFRHAVFTILTHSCTIVVCSGIIVTIYGSK